MMMKIMMTIIIPISLSLMASIMMKDITPVDTDNLILAKQGGAEVQLFISEQKPGTLRALALWKSFFEDRGLKVRIISSSSKPAFSDSAAVMAFETEAVSPVASQAGVDIAGLKNTRQEAHLLVIKKWNNRPLVLVVGRTDKGTSAGADQLLSKVSWQEGTVSVAPMEKLRQPFLEGREATIASTGRVFCHSRPELMKKINYQYWSKEQLTRYVRYLRACGFNSIQLAECLKYAGGAKRDEVAPVLIAFAEAAHKEGLSVTQYIWGSADGFHWDDPKTNKQRKERYIGLAQTYARHVDHVVTHWKDEGDEGGYVTPQVATVFLYEQYRKLNPNIKFTIDTWANEEFWSGAGKPGFLDETYSPTDIGIALHRWYEPGRAALIKKASRRTGIWSWYISDYEMRYASHLESRILDKYFSALPSDAGDMIDWISMELCFHTLPSEINLYIAGQKMWEPKRSIKEIMLDYCRAVYGAANAEIMREVYETVDLGQKDYKRYGVFIPPSDRFPDVHKSTEFRSKARQSLAKLEKVRFPAGWKPNFAVVSTPEDDVHSLRNSLEALVEGKYPEF